MGLWDWFGGTAAPEVQDDTIRAYECDYDKNCTALYTAIENREWIKVTDFMDTGKWLDDPFSLTLFAPEDPITPERQARTWVTRYHKKPTKPTPTQDVPTATDPEGDAALDATTAPEAATTTLPPAVEEDEDGALDPIVKWTQLPLHAAILFGAPPKVVEMLLTLYPHSARCTDNMLRHPLHLAMKVGADDSVLRLLVEIYPAAISKKDTTGKTPTLIGGAGPRRLLIKIIDDHVFYTKEIMDKQNKKDIENAKLDLEGQLKEMEVSTAQIRTNASESIYLTAKAERDAIQKQLDQAKAEAEAARKAIEYQSSKKHAAQMEMDLYDAREEALAKLQVAATAGQACNNQTNSTSPRSSGRQAPWSAREEEMLLKSPMAKLPTTPTAAAMTQTHQKV
jgi:hypothetical protein